MWHCIFFYVIYIYILGSRRPIVGLETRISTFEMSGSEMQVQEEAMLQRIVRAHEAVLKTEEDMLEALLAMEEEEDIVQPDHAKEMQTLACKFHLPLPRGWAMVHAVE